MSRWPHGKRPAEVSLRSAVRSRAVAEIGRHSGVWNRGVTQEASLARPEPRSCELKVQAAALCSRHHQRRGKQRARAALTSLSLGCPGRGGGSTLARAEGKLERLLKYGSSSGRPRHGLLDWGVMGAYSENAEAWPERHQASPLPVRADSPLCPLPLRRRDPRAPEDKGVGGPAALSATRSEALRIAPARRPRRRRLGAEGRVADRMAEEGSPAAGQVRRWPVGSGQECLEPAARRGRASGRLASDHWWRKEWLWKAPLYSLFFY